MLIPLFGLQMILTVHRPTSSTQTAEQLHEFVFLLTVGSQVRYTATGGLGRLALARWAGWSRVQVGCHVKC